MSPRTRASVWIEVTTAGYTRYDTPEFLEAMRARGTAFCNVSEVFADSCAQHVLAMMLALGRQLLASHKDQLTVRGWEYAARRYNSRNCSPARPSCSLASARSGGGSPSCSRPSA